MFICWDKFDYTVKLCVELIFDFGRSFECWCIDAHKFYKFFICSVKILSAPPARCSMIRNKVFLTVNATLACVLLHSSTPLTCQETAMIVLLSLFVIVFPVELTCQFSIGLADNRSLQSCETHQFPEGHQIDLCAWFAHSSLQYEVLDSSFFFFHFAVSLVHVYRFAYFGTH